VSTEILLQKKLLVHLNIRQNRLAVGAPPRTPLGELTALPQTPNWWGGAGCPPPQKKKPSLFRPLGPQQHFGPSVLAHHDKILRMQLVVVVV